MNGHAKTKGFYFLPQFSALTTLTTFTNFLFFSKFSFLNFPLLFFSSLQRAVLRNPVQQFCSLWGNLFRGFSGEKEGEKGKFVFRE